MIIKRPARARIKARKAKADSNFTVDTFYSPFVMAADFVQDNFLWKFDAPNDDTVKWIYTIVLSIFAFVLGYVPLYGGFYDKSNATMTYRKGGTMMTLGTQPFVMAGMLYNLAFGSNRKEREDKPDSISVGLLLSLAQCINFAIKGYVAAAVQLSCISFLMLNLIHISDTLEKVSLSTALIVAQGSLRITGSDWVSNTLSLLCIFSFCYIHEMHIPVRLKHKKQRTMTSVKLPLLYSGTTPLIIYYTLEEWLSSYTSIFLPIFVALPAIFGLCYYWPQVASTTGYDLGRKYAEQDFTLHGYRDASAVGKFLQRQVTRLTYVNALILVAMASVTSILNPSVSAGTLLIVVQAVQEHMPSTQLRERLRQLRKLFRL
jgi:preprotein translocase subunit SecY